MKNVLRKKSFRDDILNFDARTVSLEAKAAVNSKLVNCASSFTAAQAKRASTAAAPLAEWVKAQLAYGEVLEQVGPLENANNRLKNNLKKIEIERQRLADELSIHDQKIASLKKEFETKTGIATKLELEVQKNEQTINQAKILISRLSDEKIRWKVEETNYNEKLANLVNTTYKAAVFTTFFSNLTEQGRKVMKKELGFENFDILSLLSTETEQLKWKKNGLSDDNQSLENICIYQVLNNNDDNNGSTINWSIINDPLQNVINFLTNYYKSQDCTVEVISKFANNFYNQLELAIRFGKILIVTNISESIPEVLIPVLKNEILGEDNTRKSLILGDKLIDFNENFKLILITDQDSNNLDANLKPYLSKYNFSETREGLSSQLLTLAINVVRPELEVQRQNLVQETESIRLKLNNLDENLLKNLVESQGNLLENQNLIESLNESKKQALEQSKFLAETEKMQLQFDQQRNVYLPLAKKAMNVYFATENIAKVSSTYKFGLKHFLKIYEDIIRSQALSAENDMEQNLDCDRIFDQFLKKIFRYFMLAIRGQDMLVVSLYLAISVRNFAPELKYALIGSLNAITSDDNLVEQSNLNANSSWPIASAKIVNHLRQKHQSIFQKITSGQLMNTGSTHENYILATLKEIIDSPENTDSLITNMVCQLIGMENLVNSENLFEISLDFPKETPTLVLIAPGTDPANSIGYLAEKSNILPEHFIKMSLGQGQQDVIIKTLEENCHKPVWFLVQNLHLYTSWIPTLQATLQKIMSSTNSGNKVHESFKIFLSCEPHHNIPVNLLENSIKISYDAPPGLKNNILRTLYEWKDKNYFAKSGATRARSLYALAWLHAVCLERKRYSPIGWVNGQNYEFNQADLRSGFIALEDILARRSKTAKKGGIAWTNLIGIYSSTIYGGRLDSLDNSILYAHLSDIFNDKLMSKTCILATFSDQSSNQPIQVSLPATANIEDYIEMTQKIVPNSNPESLGLAQNIYKTIVKQRLAQVIQNLNALSTGFTMENRGGSGSTITEKTDTTENENVALLQKYWKKYKAKLKLNRESAGILTKSDDPLIVFLRQEFDLYENFMNENFDKQLCQYGTNLTKFGSNLTQNIIPEEWSDFTVLPSATTPSEFIKRLVEKANNFQNLATHLIKHYTLEKLKNSGRKNLENLKLCYFLQPVSFLKTCQQIIAILNKTTVDNIICLNEGNPFQVEIDGKTDLVLAINNVSIEGAKMNSMELDGKKFSELSKIDEPNNSLKAPLKMFFTLKSRLDEKSLSVYERYMAANFESCSNDILKIPVYGDRIRKEKICDVLVASDQAFKWLRTNVALFC